MRVSIMNQDETKQSITIDDVSLCMGFTLSDDISSIEWNSETLRGLIKYTDRQRANEQISDFSDYDYLIQAYIVERHLHRLREEHHAGADRLSICWNTEGQ